MTSSTHNPALCSALGLGTLTEAEMSSDPVKA